MNVPLIRRPTKTPVRRLTLLPDFVACEPSAHNDDTSESETSDTDIEGVDWWQARNYQEVNRLSEEGSPPEVCSGVEKANCQNTLRICALETFHICRPLKLVVAVVFFPDGFDEMREAGFNVIIGTVDEGHGFLCGEVRAVD